MKTKAVRLYGTNDLRLEEFTLPEIKQDQILAHVISDSICMSSYKATMQGSAHKRVPDNIATNPIIIGHEFCGEIVQVGDKWKDKFIIGQKFAIQPAVNYKGSFDAPGYSYEYTGGAATYIIIPNEFMENGCLLDYTASAYFYGSLAEPMSCIVGAFHANYHTKAGSYVHQMGICENGNLAILAGAGPMGLGAIDYAIHCNLRPKLIVVTDIDDARLNRAKEIISESVAKDAGVTLKYINTKDIKDVAEYLLEITDNKGYNDVFVYAPVAPVVETADKILAKDGCLNFFAGPTDTEFSAKFNFYNVHYNATHIVGTSGGNTDDMIESINMVNEGKLDPSAMITHIGGLDAVAQTTKNLPKISGGKKLIYTNISLELVALEDLNKLGEQNEMFKELDKLVKQNNGLWSDMAEKYLLSNAKPL